MWMGHDAAWWGLVLAIVALALMLPANLLANFLTPILKDWWAERSIESAKRRYKKLVIELEALELLHPNPDWKMALIFLSLQTIVMIATLSFEVLQLIIVILITAPAMSVSHPKSIAVRLLAVVTTIAICLLTLIVTKQLRRAMIIESASHRTDLQDSIEKLKQKLI